MRNWSDVLPPHVALAQKAWDMRMRVHHARRAGATLNEIAKKMRLSRERVRQIEHRAARDIREDISSPIEVYFAERPWKIVSHWDSIKPRRDKIHVPFNRQDMREAKKFIKSVEGKS